MSARRPVRWGICGTGRMADVIAAELASLSGQGAVLQAVASRTPDAAAGFARRHGIARPHAGYAALAADPEVDAVYIALPPSLHAEVTLVCTGAGKAVLCEKPFALNAGEAARMIAAAKSRGVFLMEAMWTRFLPAIVAARELVTGGAIGPVRLMIGGGGFVPDYDPALPLFNRDLGGGVLLDAGVYLVSLASMLLGPPTEVVTRGRLGPSGVDEQEVMLMSHAGGAQAALYVSLKTRRSPDLTLLGEHGQLVIDAPIFRPTRLLLRRGTDAPVATEFPVEGSGYAPELLEVMRAVRSGATESAVMPLAETLAVMRTLDAARQGLGLRYPQE